MIGSSRYDNWKPEADEIEIGWTYLSRAYWGGTYNREIKRLMLDHIHHQPTDECPDAYLLAVRQFLADQPLEHASHYEHHHPHDAGLEARL